MDNQILSLYAKGMTTREIAVAFKELYDADVSPALFSKVTDAVMEQASRRWKRSPAPWTAAPARSWQSNWANLATFFAYPADIRKVIPACHQKAQGVPHGRLSEKGGMAGNPVRITEMDDASEGLAYGDEPLYYRVR